MKKQGFTLAEVLITLGIIGVVAAMTIPTLMANSEKQQTVVKLKKFYTTFNQALAQYAGDNGCAGDLKGTGLFTGNSLAVQATVGDELVKYLNVAQNCKLAADGKCFILETTMLTNNSYSTIGSGWQYKFMTVDGLSVAMSALSPGNCNYVGFGTPPGDGALQSVCGQVYVDVNGIKPPNKFGRDTFGFDITGAATLIPHGVQSYKSSDYRWNGTTTSYRCNATAGSDGRGCAGRILEEGWELNY